MTYLIGTARGFDGEHSWAVFRDRTGTPCRFEIDDEEVTEEEFRAKKPWGSGFGPHMKESL